MKKTGIFFTVFLFSGIIFGQSTLDYLLKARAFTKTGKPDQSIEILSSAITIQKDSRFYSERAEARIIKGDYAGAIADYNSANSISQFSGEYGLSRVYALKGDPATSLYHLEISMKSTFKRSEKEILLDPAFSKIENNPGWRQFWKKEWYSDLEKNISEIEYYTYSGKTSDAMAIYTELEKNYPDNENVKYADALINLSAGRYAAAVKILTALSASDNDNEKYLRTLARAQTGSLNPAGASLTYSKLIDLEIPDAELFIYRAECYRKTGETDKALSDIKKYLSVYPEDKVALSIAGKIEAASGDNLKALQYFSENLKNHPNDPQCYVDRANSYFLSKSWDWAVKDYSMSLDLDPGNSEVWLNKGIALLSSGKHDEACHDFRQALSLGNKKATEYISRNCIK